MDLLIYGIPIVNIAILIGVSLLISKRIDSHLSNKQKIDKEIKEKVITQHKKSLLSNIIEVIFLFSFVLVILSPVSSIADLIIHLIFPSPPKEPSIQLIIMVYIFFNIFFLVYILSFIYVFKWLKKNLHPILCEWERERKNKKEKKLRN
jgi:hypothetical protein